MNNENFHPVQAEPPAAHALHKWDEATGILRYEYNGRDIITLAMPGIEQAGFRHGSDGTVQSVQHTQQIYVETAQPQWCVLEFALGPDTVCMRPHRAAGGSAIAGQLGRPLVHGVNGLYDATQDLLLDFHGCEWRWRESEIAVQAGVSHASIEVLIGPRPFFLNLRMHYYRRHLGYSYHKPWQRQPDMRAVAGWCSWEAYRRDVDLTKVEEISALAAEKLAPWGLSVIQVDDGYQKMPLPYDGTADMAQGWMACEEEKFPGGHGQIVQTIAGKGLLPGIWTNANITNPDFPAHHPDDVLWHEGKPLKGEWIDYLYSCLPDTLARQVKPIFEAYGKAGYGYLKIDAIRHLLFDGLHEAVRLGILTNEEAERRFRAYMEATREGLGEDVYYLASWGEMHEVVGVADACRIAMDANPTWAGVRMQLFETARWFHTQRVLFLNDPDHVCARTRTDWARSVLSLISLSGSLYMLSDTPDAYTEEKLDIIRKTLPPLCTRTAETGPLDMAYPAYTWTKLHGFAVQSCEKPVEAEDVSLEDALNMAGAYPTMEENHPFSSLWAFHLCAAGQVWCVMARFATVPLEACHVPFEALGLNPAAEYHAYDFWAEKYLGTWQQGVDVPGLALGQCQVVALRAVQARPQLLASTRHVSMGAVSVQEYCWHKGILRLKLAGVPGTKERYTIHRNGWQQPVLANMAGGQAALGQQGPLATLDIAFESGLCDISLAFANGEKGGESV